MTAPADYSSLFRAAHAALHGGEPDDSASYSGRLPTESTEEFLARGHSQALDKLRGRLEAAEPPTELRVAHGLLVRLLACAAEADSVLADQMEAYRCGNFQGSISHSDRLHAIVSESARLDRDLILALREAEETAPGTLSALDISDIPPPP